MAQNIDSTDFWKTKLNGFNNNFVCNVCRLCANICDNSVPIFDKIHQKGSIYSKLKKCIPSISVLENDYKPKQICLMCVSKLELCLSFIEMSLDSDRKFGTALVNRSIPQIQITNDFSWLQNMKQEPIWNVTKPAAGTVTMAKADQKLPQVASMLELPSQTFQEKSYQQLAQVPVSSASQYSLQDGSNLEIVLQKQDVNHNVLPTVCNSDGLSSQDLILLVELKKDSCSVLPVKKNQPVGQNITGKVITGVNNYQNKIMDTGQSLRTLNGSDFDDKFNNGNQSRKVTSSFVNDNASTAQILKALESEVLNGVIKLENLDGESVTTNLNSNFATTSIASTPNVVDSIKTSSAQPTTRDFECNVCNKVFSRRNRLNAHLARHSSVRPHSCDKCDQRFITRWDLTLHLRIHSGIFSCEFCGKAFPAKGKLERHRRTHTGERPYPCDLCNKAFSEKRNLENHLKTHAAAEARQVTSANGLCLTCGRNMMVDGEASTTKTKCESCQQKPFFDALDVLGRNLGVRRDASKCQSNQQSSQSNSNVSSNTVSSFLKT